MLFKVNDASATDNQIRNTQVVVYPSVTDGGTGAAETSLTSVADVPLQKGVTRKYLVA